MDTDDDLFDLEKLRLPEALMVEGTAAAKATRRRQQFVKFPCSWVERLQAARHIGSYRLARGSANIPDCLFSTVRYQESSLTQSAHSVRQVLTAYTRRHGREASAER